MTYLPQILKPQPQAIQTARPGKYAVHCARTDCDKIPLLPVRAVSTLPMTDFRYGDSALANKTSFRLGEAF
jgi:hypothetical protein